MNKTYNKKAASLGTALVYSIVLLSAVVAVLGYVGAFIIAMSILFS